MTPIFRCNTKVSKWGLSWKDLVGSKAIIVPHFFGDPQIHFTFGLSVVELEGLNNKTILVVVEERLPKYEHYITYGLILNLNKLSLE